MKLFKKYLETPLLVKMSIGFILGIITGLILGPSAGIFEPLGTLFLNLLQMIVIPLILFTLIVAANNSNPAGLGRVGGKIFAYYLLTTAIAVTVGIIFSVVFNPARGVTLGDAKVETPEAPSFVETLLNIVPSNIFEALVEADVLAIVFAALVFGFAISYMRYSEDRRMKRLGGLLFDISDAITEATLKILKGVLQYAPIGVFGIGASTFGNQSLEVLGSLIALTVVTYSAFIVHLLAVYLVLLLIFKVPVIKFFKNIREAMAVSFITSSSLGTLPVTLESAKKAEISEEVSSFTIPIGATVNMDGAAIRLGIAAIFAATIAGEDLTLSGMFLIVVTATLTSIGTAGVPGAGIVALSIVLTQAGLPLEVVAIVAGVDAIIQMGSTSLNITGDLTGAKLVDESEKRARRRKG
ncbi:sodium:dicarboxylate symporter [Salinicoccus sediminis]|uniref:Sodium:dicarboxylate symporter n=1 Tax=Salinicoccus sediminis TaxID=1432562 RepID=A0A0M2SH19_9STAP|nr:dicarboxylate/amino acid:cation symporter [Salinicoccus sediminis]KKK32881.1 sodium:dicarboxylate symporter [Salinicoccus sediminis]